jgi:hypothetical protein
VRVEIESGPGQVAFTMRLDEGESLHASGQGGMSIRLITNSFSLSHPDFTEDMHPDILALAAALVLGPWVGRRLDFNIGVSEAFAQSVREGLGFDVGPVDRALAARRQGSELGLLFSGGVDSVANLSLVPTSAPLIYLRRVRHRRIPDRATHVRTDVNMDIAAAVAGDDRPLHVVESDLEYLCGPFPTYGGRYTLGVGAVLLADSLDLGGIVRGTTIDGRYLAPTAQFTTGESSILSWRGPFAAAGIPMSEPTSGASEVVLMRAVRESGVFPRTRSCQLGPPERSCQQCLKCYRKELIIAALERSQLPRWTIDNARSDERFRSLLARGRPIPLQHVYEYALPRIGGLEGTVFSELADMLGSTEEGTEWASAYYRPALDDLPSRWVDVIVPGIPQLSRYMTRDEERRLRTWSAVPSRESMLKA